MVQSSGCSRGNSISNVLDQFCTNPCSPDKQAVMSEQYGTCFLIRISTQIKQAIGFIQTLDAKIEISRFFVKEAKDKTITKAN